MLVSPLPAKRRDVKETPGRMEEDSVDSPPGLSAAAAQVKVELDEELRPDAPSPVMAALAQITQGMKELQATMADLTSNAATKKDLNDLRKDMAESTKILVAEAVDPLKHEMRNLRNRISKIEASPAQLSSAQGSGSADFNKILNSLDPALRRVAIVGLPDGWDAAKRIDVITKSIAEQFSSFKPLDVGCFFSGPYNNRKLTKACYVEFGSQDMVTAFLKKLPTGQGNFKVQGADALTAKQARTKVNAQRNYSLRKAEELIKADPKAKDKNVQIHYKDRLIKVDDSIAFKQDKHELGGTFSGGYDHLALP